MNDNEENKLRTPKWISTTVIVVTLLVASNIIAYIAGESAVRRKIPPEIKISWHEFTNNIAKLRVAYIDRGPLSIKLDNINLIFPPLSNGQIELLSAATNAGVSVQ